MDDRLRQQIGFILAADREKEIFRQNYLADGSRRENDAEHAWHLALMTVLLKEYASREVDVLKVMTMVLIHDVVEIDAGDTYAYDYEALKDAAERERKAADRLFGLLPADQGRYLRELWEEFEAYESPEARFAHVLDNFQPFLLNAESGGKSWKEHGASDANVYRRNRKTPATSPAIWAVMEEIIRKNVENGNLRHEETPTAKL